MKKTLNLLIIISLIFFSCSKDDDDSNSISINSSDLCGDGWITWEADSWELNGDEMISQIAFVQEYYCDGNNVISAAADASGYVTYTTDTYSCSGDKINYTSTDPSTMGATTQAKVTKITSTELDITISDGGDTHKIKMFKYDNSMTDNNIKAKALEQENNLSFVEVLNKVKTIANAK